MKTITLQVVQDYAAPLLISLAVIAVFILLFLFLRAIILWYWRIDTIIENQEKQINLLTQLLKGASPIRPGSEYHFKQ